MKIVLVCRLLSLVFLLIESLHNSFGLAIGRNISYFGEFSPLSFYYGLGCWSLLC